MKYIEDPIVALATPRGESAIGVIRLSGKGSLHLLEKMYKGRASLSASPGNEIFYGKIIDPDNNEEIDEVLISVFKAPRSYTGEEGAEISCHGSLAIINRLLELFLKQGFRNGGPGEFTQRAFLNGKMDLTRAEAVNDIIRAKSDRGRALALSRLSGTIEKRINDLKEKLKNLLAAIEIHIDYPEEDIDEKEAYTLGVDELIKDIRHLGATYSTGRIIQEGVSMVIAGKTNAGKSTLFNLLLREDRAIVSDTHGTTRDYIEGLIAIRGIPIRLFDTAGLRSTIDPIEQEGIKRTDVLVENAALLLFVLDSNRGMSKEEEAFIKKYEKKVKVILVWNKRDMNDNAPPPGGVPFSAETGLGLEDLNALIGDWLLEDRTVDTAEPVIDSIRQKELLERCALSLERFKTALHQNLSLDLLAIDLKEGMDALGEITGAVTTEELLETMFSRFCVGK